MEHYVMRLYHLGYPMDVAYLTCREFCRERDWDGLADYVNLLERERLENVG